MMVCPEGMSLLLLVRNGGWRNGSILLMYKRGIIKAEMDKYANEGMRQNDESKEITEDMGNY